MRKQLLLTGFLFAGIFASQAETTDFKYPASGDGIYYSILDESNHFVKTKAGSITPAKGEQRKPVIEYGNTVSGALEIPETVEYNGRTYTVVEIGEFGFDNALTSVTLPSTLKRINDAGFYNTQISTIEIPESVTTIGAHAFDNCNYLNNVRFSEGLISIDAFAFYKCSQLNEIILPASLDAIGAGAFIGCNQLKTLTSLNIYPPALTANSFAVKDAEISVPNQALDSYKSSSWSKVGTIQSIPVPATSVVLDRTAMVVYVGGTHMPLHATAYPASSTQKISWSSSDENVAKMENGLVVGKSEGEAVITATCGTQTATCTVTVRKMTANSVTVDLPPYNIYVGDEYTFTASVYPQNIEGTLTWSTSNEKIATIDNATGKLKALSPGMIVVYAQCDDKKGAREITIHEVPATSIGLNKTSLQLQTNDTFDLEATVSPANTTYPTLVWKSSNEGVATVNNGHITAMGLGTATITVYCGSMAYNTCDVTVEETPANEVILSESTVNLKESQDQKLSFTVLPETTTDKTVVWTSLDPKVAEVSVEGVITAKSSGVARIEAKCGEAVSVCTVNVEEILPEEIIINMGQLSLRNTESMQLSANREVSWRSENEKVATVSSNGMVVATGLGQTSIIAEDGIVSANCVITVEEMPAEQIILNEGKVIANVGEPYSLIASILPLTTTNTNIVWTSDMPEIATVENGVITGIAPGNAIITAVCGNAYAVCNVTVLSPARSINLNSSSISMKVGEIEGLIAKIDPFDSTDTQIEWTSSNPSVAEVNFHGIVQAISKGNAVITATCGQQSADCNVYVANEDVTVGISEILPDSEGTYNVCDLNGINILKTTVKDNLISLPAGIYIINGKKTVIR